MRKYPNLILSILLISLLSYLIFSLEYNSGMFIFGYIIVLIGYLSITGILSSLLSMNENGVYYFLLSIFDKKTFFKYKGKWYFTWIDDNRVRVTRTMPFKFSNKSIGAFDDTDDINLYKENLKSLIQQDISNILEKKLERRKKRDKYKIYNEIN